MQENLLRVAVAAIAAAALLLPGAAHATIAYDQTIPAIYGSGNPSTAWTADNESLGLQLGIRAQPRYTGGTYTPTGDVYHVPLGDLSSPYSLSKWGWAFSATGLPAGATSTMTITNVLTGQTSSFDPLKISDNVTSGGYTQNSETLSYLVFAPGGAFDDTLNDTYNFDWTAFSSGGSPLGSVSMVVVAGTGAPVPEPSSLILGVGVLFLAALTIPRRRSSGRQSTAA